MPIPATTQATRRDFSRPETLQDRIDRDGVATALGLIPLQKRTEQTITTATLVKFERIGRHHNVPDLLVPAGVSRDELEAQIWAYAKKRLFSRFSCIDLNSDLTRGAIGWGRHGSFTLEAVA